MTAPNSFQYMHSNEAETPSGVWNWAKRTVDELNRYKALTILNWFGLLDLTGNAGKVVKVKADGSGFELGTDAVGAGGTGPATTTTAIAGESLSGNRAVYIADDGKAYYADKDVASSRRTSGLTTGAVSLGATATVQLDGIVTEAGWAWAGDSPVWLLATGLLSQIAPTTGYLVQVGVPMGPTKLRIEPQLVAQL